jgi:hypothetical protein
MPNVEESLADNCNDRGGWRPSISYQIGRETETGPASNQIQFGEVGTIAVLRVSQPQQRQVCRLSHLEERCERRRPLLLATQLRDP